MTPFTQIRAITLLLTIALVGCGKGAEMMNAEFSNLADCLVGIEKNSGQSLKVVTDKPSEVSGRLSNGEAFACQQQESGTKGTYFQGWYSIK